MVLLKTAVSAAALTLLMATGALVTVATAQSPTKHQTENVILVMIDGMRWQEVFRGADPELLEAIGPAMTNDEKQRAAIARQRYAGSTASERRKALMPFLWSVVSSKGQLFGNRDLGSDSHVINGLNFSYPGYSETLTGLADPRVDSNDNVPNPNPTVFEWLNAKPEFAGKVAAFGAWNVFSGIFRSQKCGFVVNAGYDALTAIPATPRLDLLNSLKQETARVWPDEPFDPLPFHTAMEYLRIKKPRVLFVGLGETDDWAHVGLYADYLNAAYLADDYLRQIWKLVQSMPAYRGRTTLIVLPDHGRGNGANWIDHGQKIPESAQTWMAFLGPDTPPLGERKQSQAVTESQIAATLATMLGEDYRASVPKAGAPISDVLRR